MVNKQDSVIESRLTVMICELSRCFSRIYSVNVNDVTFVLGPGFFSFAAGGLVSSMVSSSFDVPSIISACHVASVLVLKSRHNRGLFCALE